MKAQKCEKCNSQMILVRDRNISYHECSYCGYSPDNEFEDYEEHLIEDEFYED